MRLYAGSSTNFIRDTAHNQIAGKLQDTWFRYYGYKAPLAEVTSWQNSLRAIAQVFQDASLTDHGVILEYQLPLSSLRLDCMICGRDASAVDNSVIVELKQWAACEAGEGDKVVTWLAGAHRDVLHPSVQVGQYQQYLEDAHSAFYEEPNPIRLSSCSFLHNYYLDEGDVLRADVFTPVLERYPLFAADDTGHLKDFLSERLEAGQGLPVLRRVEESRYRPSRKLMDHVANLIAGKSEYVLLDDQLVVYENVMAAAQRGFHDRRKTVLIIKGGPGTGKSLIAINLMGDLSRGGYNTHYATGSRAFTQTLQKKLGSRASAQIKYFNSYLGAEQNAVDVLICDESHRIRETSDSRFNQAKRTGEPQVDELIDAGKVSVFFIDDRQVVRPGEIGSAYHIREHAERSGAVIHEYQLEAQFRCAGSDGFVRWIENTLDIARTANVIWEESEGFEFRIMSSPSALEDAIREKVAGSQTARVTAGFCWKWSKPQSDGTLVEDVVLGDYRRPWNAKSGAGRLAPGIPKEALWATDPRGIDQVGCVYTAQGFEFDYVGVIFGNDLRYDFDRGAWVGHPECSQDNKVKRSGSRFLELVKNTYRVLLSRGIKGCYVYFMDRDTERFVRTRLVRSTEVL
jgi:DUF2075 family protein